MPKYEEAPRRVPLPRGQLLSLMEEVFSAGGVFPFAPLGRSMLPMLRERRDSVVLASPAGREIKPLDVVLYLRREESPEAGENAFRPVLHRVIGVSKEGVLTLCGDRQTVPEHGISREQVLGVLVEFTRKGKRRAVTDRGYRIYARLWVWSRPFRRAAAWLFGRREESGE